MSIKQNCWLDCDPGHDDSFAIILATYCDSINLIGISTVSGNQTIEKTTKNALNVLNLIGHVKSTSESLAYPLIQGTFLKLTGNTLLLVIPEDVSRDHLSPKLFYP